MAGVGVMVGTGVGVGRGVGVPGTGVGSKMAGLIFGIIELTATQSTTISTTARPHKSALMSALF